MGSASVSSNNMLLLLGFLELPKNPVVAAGVARGARRWCGAGAVVLRAGGSSPRCFGIFCALESGEFSLREALSRALSGFLRVLGRVGIETEPSKNVRVYSSSKSACCSTQRCNRGRLKTRSAVIDGRVALGAHGEPRLAAQREVTLPCGTTQ